MPCSLCSDLFPKQAWRCYCYTMLQKQSFVPLLSIPEVCMTSWTVQLLSNHNSHICGLSCILCGFVWFVVLLALHLCARLHHCKPELSGYYMKGNTLLYWNRIFLGDTNGNTVNGKLKILFQIPQQRYPCYTVFTACMIFFQTFCPGSYHLCHKHCPIPSVYVCDILPAQMFKPRSVCLP